MPSAASFPQFSPQRLRSYVLRLPLCTRLLLLVVVAFWVAGISNGFQHWAQLIPKEVLGGGMHRINTYPFLHVGFIHMISNVIALTPLLERFESEHGTLTTLILFTGPFSTFPAALYLLLQLFLFRLNTPIEGASIWIILLLSATLLHSSKSQPYYTLPDPASFLPRTYRLPTASIPLILIILTSILSNLHILPPTSLLGHLCGAVVGYAWGLGWIRFLAPPEKVLRWVEGKLNLLGRIPHYVSVDQKVYGRYGVLPQTNGVNGVPLQNV
ncbi:putative rhomboid family protein [Tothia fuscella]|uniref:rhomboid protease n=1 Tax=Tothia fuscella TaxID=1048955 RepID=A0A9P4U2D9_9PEZI|nr:putative rhomboid family protein [Tothia fuscella]